jgi:hypothetical protein
LGDVVLAVALSSQRGRRWEMGDGRWEMGDGRWGSIYLLSYFFLSPEWEMGAVFNAISVVS